MLLLLGGVEHDRGRLDRRRVLGLSWVVCSRCGGRRKKKKETKTTKKLKTTHIGKDTGTEVASRGTSGRERDPRAVILRWHAGY